MMTKKQKEKPLDRDDFMYRTRAVRCLADTDPTGETEIEGFMAIFHPEFQKNRGKMRELKNSMKIPQRWRRYGNR